MVEGIISQMMIFPPAGGVAAGARAKPPSLLLGEGVPKSKVRFAGIPYITPPRGWGPRSPPMVAPPPGVR